MSCYESIISDMFEFGDYQHSEPYHDPRTKFGTTTFFLPGLLPQQPPVDLSPQVPSARWTSPCPTSPYPASSRAPSPMTSESESESESESDASLSPRPSPVIRLSTRLEKLSLTGRSRIAPSRAKKSFSPLSDNYASSRSEDGLSPRLKRLCITRPSPYQLPPIRTGAKERGTIDLPSLNELGLLELGGRACGARRGRTMSRTRSPIPPLSLAPCHSDVYNENWRNAMERGPSQDDRDSYLYHFRHFSQPDTNFLNNRYGLGSYPQGQYVYQSPRMVYA